MNKRLIVAISSVLLLAASEARAQTAGEALRNLLFEPLEGQGALSSSLSAAQALYALLLSETTTFPVGSSAGGFTWTFDPGLGAPARRSQSFGPMFAERPFTTGMRRLNLGVAFQHTRFDSVAGEPLADLKGGVEYNFGESFYTYGSSLKVAIDRTIVSANYGVTGRVDVGVIVPIGRARVSGNSSYSQRDDINGAFTLRQSRSASSSGLGDVILRTKAAIFSAHKIDGAVSMDVRLPTGDADKLLGTGQTQAKLMLIAAASFATVTPHVNVGYTFGGKGLTFGAGDELISSESSQEFDYTAGADIAVTSAMTIAGDVIGRSLRKSANIDGSIVVMSHRPIAFLISLSSQGRSVCCSARWA